MSTNAAGLLNQIRSFAGQDVGKNCNYRFKNFLRLALIDKQISHRAAQDVVVVMPVSLPDEGLPDEYLQELSGAIAEVLTNLHDAYEADEWADPEAALVEAARSVKVWLTD
jgi:hypothetical protein